MAYGTSPYAPPVRRSNPSSGGQGAGRGGGSSGSGSTRPTTTIDGNPLTVDQARSQGFTNPQTGQQQQFDSAYLDQVAGNDAAAASAAANPGSYASPYQIRPLGPEAGLNFATPGAMESFFADNRDRFSAPTAGSSFFEENRDRFSNPRELGNRSDTVFQDFFNRAPADMSTYYDNARRKASEAIDTASAARGTYASSGAMDMINEAMVDIGAQEARDNAQYGLDRAMTAGNLASSADISEARGSSDMRDWLNSGVSAANQADIGNLAFLNAGTNAASAAQDAQRQRGQDFFNNTLAIGDRGAGIVTDAGNDMIQTDLGLMDTATALRLGLVSEGQINAARNQGQFESNLDFGLDTFNALRTTPGAFDFGDGSSGAASGAASGRGAYDESTNAGRPRKP